MLLRDCPRFDVVRRLLRFLHCGIFSGDALSFSSRLLAWRLPRAIPPKSIKEIGRGLLPRSFCPSENVLNRVEIRCCLEDKVLGTNPAAILGTIPLKRFLGLLRSLPKMNRREVSERVPRSFFGFIAESLSSVQWDHWVDSKLLGACLENRQSNLRNNFSEIARRFTRGLRGQCRLMGDCDEDNSRLGSFPEFS